MGEKKTILVGIEILVGTDNDFSHIIKIPMLLYPIYVI